MGMICGRTIAGAGLTANRESGAADLLFPRRCCGFWDHWLIRESFRNALTGRGIGKDQFHDRAPEAAQDQPMAPKATAAAGE